MKSSLFKRCQIKNATVTDDIYNILITTLLLIESFDSDVINQSNFIFMMQKSARG